MNFSKEDLFCERLDPKNIDLIKSFQCHEKELVDFLVEDAYNNQINKISVTYLFFLVKTRQLVGYVTVLADAINLNAELKKYFRDKDIHYKSLPALKVGRIAVDDRFAGKGIGTCMMKFSIFLSVKIYQEAAGCRFITLDAKRSRAGELDPSHFYKKIGFNVLKGREKGTIPMYMDTFAKPPDGPK